MTPARIESLRAEFEAVCATLPEHARPKLLRVDGGPYQFTYARAMFAGWQMAHAHYCDGEASGPEDLSP